MAEQPQSMDELVASVRRVASYNPNKVTPTIATRELVELSTGARQLLTNYLQQAQAEAMAIAAAAPGAMLEARQTDQWYRTHDRDGNYGRLRSIVEVQAMRNR